MAITVHEPASLTAVLDTIEAFQQGTTTSWYRGCGDTSHTQLPTLYRHPVKKTREDRQALEVAIRLAFTQRAMPFVGRTFSNDWDQLFFMQHYGIPTRLLDWTENPFVALYFALSSGPRDKKGDPTADASVLLSDPIAWNRAALSLVSFAGGILDETSTQIQSYKPESDFTDMYSLPVMMHGTHNSPRIVAQRGVFCLFGQEAKSMEKVAEDGAFPDSALQKILIRKENVLPFLVSLYRKGFVESVIYPDIQGLSAELKRSFGY